LYKSVFPLFNDTLYRYANETLNFESTIILTDIAFGGVDFLEAIVTLNKI